ncbi:amidase [Sporolactobacillus shoreae]|uniref:Amidase n=1 Tax=Sporolactobacillus shoreae TaxID=1465501 RepID=A0A4Z0GI13_9BACL|nr:amidase [Sporolactobacillus shoreae]TGA96178.1 amidase [Sporolactobacillus shoreae]
MSGTFSLSAIELINAYRKGSLTPVEVIRDALNRIDRLNPLINAFVTLNREEALHSAETSGRRYKEKTALPLDGVPVAIKDLTNTKGLRTTYGSLVYENHIPGYDATVVARLKSAGAVLLGKTNTPEFGHKGTTNNRLFGASRNPWQTDNGTGGSSGGSAAAVAAGFCPLAEGSDGGGSIRIPSSLCGVFGFKPSFGRIPADNHPEDLFANTLPFISYGPITRTVSDAALMFDVMQGPSVLDPYSLDRLDPPISETLGRRKKQFRIGYTVDFGMYEVDSEIQSVFYHALESFSESGAIVEPAEIRMNKDLEGYVHYFNRLWMIGLAVSTKNLMAEHRDELSETLISMIRRGENATAEELLNMNNYRTYLWKMFQGQFPKFDVLVSPTLAAAVYPFNSEGPERINGKQINPESDWMMTSPVNLTGQPACSLPIGFTTGGIPVGMQCIGRRLNDRGLFQFARWAETLLKIPTLASM